MTLPTPEPRDGSSFRLAFEKSLAAMKALPEEELLRPNVDVPTVIPRILGALPALRSLRPEIARKLPEHDLSLLDHLESFTLALAHAHALTLAASERPAGDLATLNAEASELREGLLADARHLARHKLVDAGRLDDIKGLVGYRQVAFDLLALATLLRQGWSAISGKTPLTVEQLDRAEHLARQIIDLLAAREQQGESATEAVQLRQRAFTLFFRAYTETKRAVTYLRWNEDDVETFCPSLFNNRRGRRSEQENPKDQDEPTDAPPVVPATPVPPAAPVNPGLPGGNPFTG
jgi:hypothetical protein